MEIHAYDEEYVPLAQRILGDMMDFAIVTLGIEVGKFADLFVASDVSRQIGAGNPAYVAGRNGCELVRLVLEPNGIDTSGTDDVMYLDKSPEYWAGWALAYYQWKSGNSFQLILGNVRLEEIVSMYSPYHEMNIEHFYDVLRVRLAEAKRITRLQHYRKALGLSQSELSRRSGVQLRQIQLFEQRQRSINKTQADTLLRLSKALYCDMVDLLEYD